MPSFVIRKDQEAVWWPVAAGTTRGKKRPCMIVGLFNSQRNWWWIEVDGQRFVATSHEIFAPDAPAP